VTDAPADHVEIYSFERDSLRLASMVSVVRLDGTPRVLQTLQVSDEPRDVVFAGTGRRIALDQA
jgi:hypothetical protein